MSPNGFSPVPYFLLCGAIELAIKAKFLEALTQAEVKKKFGHDLEKMYNALDNSDKILTAHEFDVLRQANSIYRGKNFEYFDPEDALTGF
ncbi:MAG: hypothetical protein IVW51_09020 [Thermaceae bacterium]|nr:hypothetical protein [Thermaceae bacterium]